MSDETIVDETSASEEMVATEAGMVDSDSQETTEQPERQVPLKALEAERKKRQEIEAQNRVLQDYALRFQQMQEQMQNQKTPVPEEDETDLVNKRDLKQFREHFTKEEFALMKREIAEETFKEVNPEAIRQINTHLKEIIERKPWLAESIDNAPNRYARAYEIVKDFAPTLAAKKNVEQEAKRIVENAKKPGSPTAVGKAANLSQVDFLKSIAGKKEFNEYRKQLLQG